MKKRGDRTPNSTLWVSWATRYRGGRRAHTVGGKASFLSELPSPFLAVGSGVCDRGASRAGHVLPPADTAPATAGPTPLRGGEAALSSASRAARWWKRKPRTTQITLDRQAFFISAAFIFKNPPGKRLLPNKAGASLHVIALKADVTKPACH